MRGLLRLALVGLGLAFASVVRAEPDSALAPGAARVVEHIGASVPLDAEFTSSEGWPLVLSSVLGRGKPALLVLAYSRCSMLCSLVLRAAADLVAGLGLELGRDFVAVTISIDPRETPFEAGRTQDLALSRAGYEREKGAWPFLVGSAAEIDRVADAVGFGYAWDERTGQYAHPAVIFVISPEGRVAGYIYSLTPDAARVRAALLGESSGLLEAVPAAVLECFRFDALGRKYGPLVQGSFQAGAALVALALGGTIWALARRERALRGGARS